MLGRIAHPERASPHSAERPVRCWVCRSLPAEIHKQVDEAKGRHGNTVIVRWLKSLGYETTPAKVAYHLTHGRR